MPASLDEWSSVVCNLSVIPNMQRRHATLVSLIVLRSSQIIL